MAVANCKLCGQMYQRSDRDICPECVSAEDAAFMTVRTYLKEHRETTLLQLVEDTGVDEELILDMLHDGRLFLGDHPNFIYECDRCGGPTQSGRYCPACSKEMTAAFSLVRDEVKQRNSAMQERGRGGYFSRGPEVYHERKK